MSDILVPLSPGELLDKITILRIKCARIEDASKLANVRSELSRLEQVRAASLPADAAVAALEAELERINSRLWDIEDRIREHEAQQRFDAAFIELARAVYLINDERAALKRRINLQLASALIEEKSYRPYRREPS
jgi:predicted  nucleic acid-binding Zn-ribbon protein